MNTRHPRISVTLTDEQVAALGRLDSAQDPLRRVLERSYPALRSQSAIVSAVLDAGLRALEDEARDEGYRQLAESLASDPEETAARAALRERRARNASRRAE